MIKVRVFFVGTVSVSTLVWGVDVELEASGVEVGTDEVWLLTCIFKSDVKSFTILLLDLGDEGTEISSHLWELGWRSKTSSCRKERGMPDAGYM